MVPVALLTLLLRCSLTELSPQAEAVPHTLYCKDMDFFKLMKLGGIMSLLLK